MNITDSSGLDPDTLCELDKVARNQQLSSIGSEYLSKADYTPILIEWEEDWSVVMSTSVREGVQWCVKPVFSYLLNPLILCRLGWADPYPGHAERPDRSSNEDDGRLTVFTKYSTFPKITQVMHLKDFVSFDGRPIIG